MNTCKTCKSWRQERDTTFGDCVSPHYHDYAPPSNANNGLFYWESDEYGYPHGGYDHRVDLCTGEDFGCIHWEKKE